MMYRMHYFIFQKHISVCKALFLSGSIVLVSTQVSAQGSRGYDEEELPEPGLSWGVSLGFGAGKMQPSASEGSASGVSSGSSSGAGSIITSLDKVAKTETEFSPLLDVQGVYVFENRKTQIDFSFGELRLSHLFDSGVSLSFGVDPSLVSSEEVFNDPFLTNAARVEDTLTAPSFFVGAGGLLGLPLSLEYTYSSQKLSNDQAGVSLLNKGGKFGVTQAELGLLKRSATSHSLLFSTAFPLSESITLSPSVGYHMTKADGAANSAKGYDLGLQLEYEVGPYTMGVGANYSPSTFDQSHPVFDKVRSDKGVSFEASFTIDEPFGWDRQRANIALSHQGTGSNINFYDSKETFFMVGWSYAF